MRRVKLLIQYDGSRYSGWQRQTGTLTIQETIENALGQLIGEPIVIQGASRTDAGVHAMGQAAHFDDSGVFPVAKYAIALNAVLPDDIAIISAEPVAEIFHARFDAAGKWYRYHVLNHRRKTVFDRAYAMQVEKFLDVEKMQQAAALLLGEHDFTSFKTHSPQSEEQDPVRSLTRLDISRHGDDVFFDVEGKSFLYKMVRGIVGSLIEVGRGRFAPDWIAEVLEKRDRTATGPNAPAHGLFLMHVSYSYKPDPAPFKEETAALL